MGYHWNRLEESVLMAGSKALLTKFDIYLILKSYGHKFALKANLFQTEFKNQNMALVAQT